jgi:diguanylate cyclase
MDPTLPSDAAGLGQRRLRRQLMGAASWMMFVLPLAFAQWQGWMSMGWSKLLLLTLIALVANAVFYLAIRRGWTARFKDPSLTFWQIFSSQLLALWAVQGATPQVRSLLITLFVASLFFGIFGLRTRQFLALTTTAFVGFSAIVLAETGLDWNDAGFRLALLQLLTLGMILLWLTFVGSHVAALRAKLAVRNAELAAAAVRLKQLVSYDELTGVFNRRHLLNVLTRERERALRYGRSFSVCLIDLDHFKQINDTYGHATGDEILRVFAARTVACARRMDWIGRPAAGDAPADAPAGAFGRYGGEEFLLVLPETPLAGALRYAERLREHIATPFEIGDSSLRVTFSAGVAEYRDEEDVAVTLARADEALYRAKAGGRDRIMAEASKWAAALGT